MDLLKIQVPFIDREEIKNRADGFRALWWGESLPVKIETIIEVKLKMRIIPTPNLRQLCDAVMSINNRCIYIDNDTFLDDRQRNRLRFSFAHELGHYVLHKDIYRQIRIFNVYEFPQSILEQLSSEQHSSLEFQANKFASYLLIPRERLRVEKEKIINQLKDNQEFARLTDNKMQNSYLAIHLSYIFGVSNEAMEIALNDN